MLFFSSLLFFLKFFGSLDLDLINDFVVDNNVLKSILRALLVGLKLLLRLCDDLAFALVQNSIFVLGSQWLVTLVKCSQRWLRRLNMLFNLSQVRVVLSDVVFRLLEHKVHLLQELGHKVIFDFFDLSPRNLLK
jgi:hypothetical protein